MELSIDTSTRYASVALSDDGRVTHEFTWRSEQNHSVEFVPALRQLMDLAAVAPSDLDAIFVARGPGGFSALRVGISVAKAMAMTQKIPLVAIGSLEVEAYPYLGFGRPVCSVIPAGKKLLYVGRFQHSTEQKYERLYQVVAPQELIESSPDGTLFCGEGTVVLTSLTEELPTSLMLDKSQPPTRRPSSLVALAYSRLVESSTDAPESLQPIYIRGSQFESAQGRVRMTSS